MWASSTLSPLYLEQNPAFREERIPCRLPSGKLAFPLAESFASLLLGEQIWSLDMEIRDSRFTGRNTHGETGLWVQ